MSEAATEAAPPEKPPEITITTSTEGGEIKRRKERNQSMTFDKVLSTYFKRPSEEIGRTVLIDKYRHESIADVDEFLARGAEEFENIPEGGEQVPDQDLPDTSTPTAIKTKNRSHTFLSAPPESSEKMNTNTSGPAHPTRSSRASSTQEKDEDEDEWDLYEHPTARNAHEDKDAPKEEIPSGCCIVS